MRKLWHNEIIYDNTFYINKSVLGEAELKKMNGSKFRQKFTYNIRVLQIFMNIEK